MSAQIAPAQWRPNHDLGVEATTVQVAASSIGQSARVIYLMSFQGRMREELH